MRASTATAPRGKLDGRPSGLADVARRRVAPVRQHRYLGCDHCIRRDMIQDPISPSERWRNAEPSYATDSHALHSVEKAGTRKTRSMRTSVTNVAIVFEVCMREKAPR